MPDRPTSTHTVLCFITYLHVVKIVATTRISIIVFSFVFFRFCFFLFFGVYSNKLAHHKLCTDPCPATLVTYIIYLRRRTPANTPRTNLGLTGVNRALGFIIIFCVVFNLRVETSVVVYYKLCSIKVKYHPNRRCVSCCVYYNFESTLNYV